MLNPALAEMAATERIAALRAAAAKRSSRPRRSIPTETTARHAPRRSGRFGHLADAQRAIGWFLISLGLRLAVPRTRTGSAR
jgi:hypothetical protein